jgi:hypothetical protein
MPDAEILLSGKLYRQVEIYATVDLSRTMRRRGPRATSRIARAMHCWRPVEAVWLQSKSRPQ